MNATNKTAPLIAKAPAPTEMSQALRSEDPIKELMDELSTEHETVQLDTQRLEVLRKYQKRLGMQRQDRKADDLIGNLISSQDDKVQDAQIDLNKSMERLAQKSLALHTVHTARAALHSAQQQVIQEHQNSLQQQAAQLQDRNQKLVEQQKKLHQRLDSIHTANEGLMTAHGITTEQAQRLVGFVQQVTEAEQQFALANQQFRSELEQNVQGAVTQCVDQLNAGFSSVDLRQSSFEEQVNKVLSAQSKRTRERLALFTGAFADFQIEMEQKLQLHTQAVVEHTNAQQAQLLQRQEASTAQLSTFQQDLRHDLTETHERTALALRELVQGVERTLQTSLYEQGRLLQAQGTSLDGRLQRLATDLNDNVGATHQNRSGLDRNMDAVNALKQQINRLEADQRTMRRGVQRVLVIVASVAVFSLAWLTASRFSWF